MSAADPAVHVVGDGAALHELAAGIVADRLSAAIARAGRGTIALSGGRTPEGLYRALAGERWRSRVDWSRVDFFFGDERHVAPDDPASNYRMAKAALLDSVVVPGTRVLRVPSEDPDAARAAARYERELQALTGAPAGSPPRLDVVLLGLGDDGHCASLFPGTAALAEQERLVVANWVEKFKTWRITFTFRLLNAARAVVFLVEGPNKAPAVAAALKGASPAVGRKTTPDAVPGTAGGNGEPDARGVPAARVRPPDGELIWLLDEAAAQSLAR